MPIIVSHKNIIILYPIDTTHPLFYNLVMSHQLAQYIGFGYIIPESVLQKILDQDTLCAYGDSIDEPEVTEINGLSVLINYADGGDAFVGKVIRKSHASHGARVGPCTLSIRPKDKKQMLERAKQLLGEALPKQASWCVFVSAG